ncbi:MAG TPA: hypothetical protein VM753_15310 [Anaeromyxobacter sp.]|nr:hypothetical protein [Anaeromyxobacter sp.]
MTRAVLPVFALSALLGAGCGGHAAQGTGVARVMAQLTDDPAIARVVVTVGPGQGSSFNPIVTDLSKTGPGTGIWLGRITDIPAGHLRQFDVKAYDSAGNVLYSGSGQSDIVAGGVAVIGIAISKPAPPPVVNSFPVIDSVAWSRDQVAPGNPVQLVASAHDPDGDPVTYGWQASCVDSSDKPLASNGSFDDPTKAAPVWTAPQLPAATTQGVCSFSLGVTDSHGATTTLAFTITVTTEVGSADVTVYLNSWPVITGMTGTVQIASTMTGDLSLQATDPDGDPLTYAWSSPDCAGIVFDTSAPYGPTTPHFTLPLPPATCKVVVTVSDGKVPAGQGTQGILYLPATIPSVLCVGVTCLSGQACNPVNGQCGGTCIPTCVGKTCGPDGCGQSCGTCSGATPLCNATGQCVAASCTPSCSGTTCGSDGCGGTCTCPASAPVCNASGQCVAACTPSCSGTTCGSDGCGGTCTCPASAPVCNASGQCVAATCTPSCSGTTCGSDGCGGTCTCSSTTPFCDASLTCVPASGGPMAVVPVSAIDLQLTPPGGLAMDTAGNSFVTGPLYSLTPVMFSGISLTPSGGADIVVAKYNNAGTIQWALDIGDDDPLAGNDQIPVAAAVTQNGTVAVIGNFSGAMTFGTSVINSSSQIDFLAALDSSGNRLWAKQFNDGSSGAISAVAANPNHASNRIAVCGKTLLAGANWTGGSRIGTYDAVIGVYDNAGNKLWAADLGSNVTAASYTSCTSVVVDDNGDVFAAGQFDAGTLTFPTGGTPISLTGPDRAGAQKWIWVAKFAGNGDGAGHAKTLAAVAYVTNPGQATPNALTADASGHVVMGGLFTSALTIGTALTSAGGNDGFVAKLDGTALAPAWPAVRIGGLGADQVNGVAVTSTGDIVATGSFAASTAAFRTANGGFDTTGIAQLHNAGGSDAFVLMLNGATGALYTATAYGDAAAQNGDRVCVDRFATVPNQVGLLGTFAGTINFGSTAGSVSSVNGGDVYFSVAKLQ